MEKVDGDISDVINGLSQMGTKIDFSEADVKNMMSEITVQSETTIDRGIFWRIAKTEKRGFNKSLTECVTEKEKSCVKSFIYNNEEHFGCINKDREKLWCATKGNFSKINKSYYLTNY